jgi:hypothetical protein
MAKAHVGVLLPVRFTSAFDNPHNVVGRSSRYGVALSEGGSLPIT